MSGALAQILAAALEGSPPPVASPSGESLEPAAIRAMAAGIAARLRERGLHPDEPVLVAIGNRPRDLGSLLGVWLAGGVAVPVPVAAVPATLASVRNATAARLSVNGEDVSAISGAPPPDRPLLRGAALIIFTSGSTGAPKGVVLGHERFGAKLDVLASLLRLGPTDVVVVPLRLTFIFGLWASLLALRAGAKLVLVPRFSAEVAAAVLADGGTVLAAVPTMLRAMLSETVPSAPALRSILTGGEALGAALSAGLRQAFPDARVRDLYGLTETGSCDFCLSVSDEPAGQGTIGTPTEGVAYRLVADDGTPAPAGTPGELQIRTPFGMLGYLNAEPLTAEPLTASSFSAGFFRTGDIARLRPDGRVELVGRSKEIISRGGNKIAPLEIDNLLASHPEVAGALCAGVPDARLGEAIHAVVVLKPGSRLTPEALRRWASERIERYKLPDAIHVGEALPLGSTGKASRAAVATLFRSAAEP